LFYVLCNNFTTSPYKTYLIHKFKTEEDKEDNFIERRTKEEIIFEEDRTNKRRTILLIGGRLVSLLKSINYI